MPSLSQLRKQIDRLDERIVMLLNRRFRLAEQIGGLKLRNGDKVYQHRREREILDRLSTQQDGPLTGPEVRAIYRRILLTSRAHQKRIFQQSSKSLRPADPR